MDQRVQFDFDFHALTDAFLGRKRSKRDKLLCLFQSGKLRAATRAARSTQLYILLEQGATPLVVYRKVRAVLLCRSLPPRVLQPPPPHQEPV